jgi:hypothetical protein
MCSANCDGAAAAVVACSRMGRKGMRFMVIAPAAAALPPWALPSAAVARPCRD